MWWRVPRDGAAPAVSRVRGVGAPPRPVDPIDLARVAAGAGELATVIGLLAIVSWLLDVTGTVQPMPTLLVMPESSAFMLVGCGVLLRLRGAPGHEPRDTPLERSLALVVATIALLRLLDDGFGVPVGIDRALPEQFTGGEDPHLRSPHTGLAFLLVGLSAVAHPSGGLLSSRHPWAGRISHVLMLAGPVVVALALAGRLLGVPDFGTSAAVEGMAPGTVLGLTGVLVGMLALRPEYPPGVWFARAGPGDVMARRMLVPAVVLPFVIGMALHASVQAGRISANVALAAMVVMSVAVTLGVLSRGSTIVERQAERAERMRTQSRQTLRRLTTLTRQAPVGVFEADAEGGFVFVNEVWKATAGISGPEAEGSGWLDAVHPDDRETLSRQWETAVAVGSDFVAEFRLRHADGTVRWVSAHSNAMWDEHGAVSGHLGTVLDVTRRHNDQAALVDAEARFRLAFDWAPIGNALIAPDGRMLRVNRALRLMLGRSEHDLVGTNVLDITHPDDQAVDTARIEEMLADVRQNFELDTRYVRADGQTLWARVSVSLVRGRDREPQYFIAQIQDISSEKREKEELRFLADHDVLTGLPNRRQFETTVDALLRRHRTVGGASTLLVLDVDGFKGINDTFGHGVGDDVIRSVADLLGDRLRGSDMVARLGGDEFAVLLVDTVGVDAEWVADDILARMRRAHLSAGSIPLRLSASIGVTDTAALPPDARTAEFVAIGDRLMYEVKRGGGDGWLRDPPQPGTPGPHRRQVRR